MMSSHVELRTVRRSPRYLVFHHSNTLGDLVVHLLNAF
jgi:hypothetical protein